MIMTRILLVAAVLLVASSGSYASDCSPGSLLFEDAFFKICDEARETEVRVIMAAEKKPDVDGVKNQSSAKRNPGDQMPPGPLALDQ